MPSRHTVKRSLIRSLLAIAVLAAAAGCISREGYELPDYRAPGGGWNPAYPPYSSGSSVYRSGYSYGYRYDPRYYSGYGGYDPFYYSSGIPGPYYYGYYPYPRYIVVPCVDNNHNGRCDRPPSHHDDGGDHGGPGHGDGDGDHDGDHDGNHGGQRHPVSGNATPRVQPRVVPPSAPPAPAVRPQPNRLEANSAVTQPDPPKVHRGARDDRPARPLIP